MTTVAQDSVPIGTGFSRSLRMENQQSVPVTDYIRVRSTGCSTSCDAADVYRIRAWETTNSIARFNNSGSQSTVMVLSNPSLQTTFGNVWFWDDTGALLGLAAEKASLLAASISVAMNNTASGLICAITLLMFQTCRARGRSATAHE